MDFRSRLTVDYTPSGDISMRELLTRVYAFAFARPGRAQAVNRVLYNLTLRGKGFNNTWEPDRSGEAWFVRHVLAPTSPDTCVDVGANRGDYSRILLTETHARVIAFEPLAECRPALNALADEYSGRLMVVPEAVGDQPGVLTIHYGDNSGLASLSEEMSGIGYVGSTNILTAPVTVTTLNKSLPTPAC